jgi:glycine/D-amino acid oxidase-like deaminating enzyme
VSRGLTAAAEHALADARPGSYWTDRAGAPQPAEPLAGRARADLVVVGGGYTGLWTALLALQENPAADVLVLEAETVGHGASGRNGGFISDSLTHGLAHGAAMWPAELPTLLRLGRANLAEIGQTLTRHGVDADLRLCGKSAMAVLPHHVDELRAAVELHRRHGEDATFLDADAARADVHSLTYLAGMRVRSGGGLVDPARLAWGLRQVVTRLGARLHERTRVTGVQRAAHGVVLRTDRGSISADRVVLGTNAFRPPLRRLQHWVLPVYDHVLVTEPLNAEQLKAIGWRENQGLTDAGNQFHYYRRTPDDRILWGGYDAIYHFGNRVDPALEQRDASHRLLARQFLETFPQLEGVRFTHRWAGVIDSTSRFTPMFGTALRGRLAYAVGYTGLGVASSRFGAQVALDLLEGRRTERTELEMVRRRPVPFPPEPLRWPAVQVTRRALARQDAEGGRRGIWLQALDRFGVGFNS